MEFSFTKSYTNLFIFLLFVVVFSPPIYVFFFTDIKLHFSPQLFVNEWYKAVLSFVGIIIGFLLIHFYWESKQKRNLAKIDKIILVKYLKKLIYYLDECLDFHNKDEKLVIQFLSKKINFLHIFQNLLKSLRESPTKKYDSDYAIQLENLYIEIYTYLEFFEDKEYVSPNEKVLEKLNNLKKIAESKISKLGASNV